MARGSAQATQAAGAGLANSQTLGANAGNLYSTLAPALQNEVANPQGFGPEQRARMTTANEQTAGGTNAGITGEGSLIEGRTRNAGGTGMALTNAARQAGKNLSNATLETNLSDAQLQEEQRQAGLRGEQGLYGTNVGGANEALNAATAGVNANTNTANESWDWSKYLVGPLLGAAGGAAPTIGKAFGAP